MGRVRGPEAAEGSKAWSAGSPLPRISAFKSLFPLGKGQHCPHLFLPELAWYKARE